MPLAQAPAGQLSAPSICGTYWFLPWQTYGKVSHMLKLRKVVVAG